MKKQITIKTSSKISSPPVFKQNQVQKITSAKSQDCHHCHLWKNGCGQKGVVSPIRFYFPIPSRESHEHYKSHELPEFVFVHFLPWPHLRRRRCAGWMSSEALGGVTVGLQHQLSENLAREKQEEICKGTLDVRGTASRRRALAAKERVRRWLSARRSPNSWNPGRRITVTTTSRIRQAELIISYLDFTEPEVAQFRILVYNNFSCYRRIHHFTDITVQTYLIKPKAVETSEFCTVRIAYPNKPFESCFGQMFFT